MENTMTEGELVEFLDSDGDLIKGTVVYMNGKMAQVLISTGDIILINPLKLNVVKK